MTAVVTRTTLTISDASGQLTTGCSRFVVAVDTGACEPLVPTSEGASTSPLRERGAVPSAATEERSVGSTLACSPPTIGASSPWAVAVRASSTRSGGGVALSPREKHAASGSAA
eukprot:4412177-Pleurochrysis_carterae.AAC.1